MTIKAYKTTCDAYNLEEATSNIDFSEATENEKLTFLSMMKAYQTNEDFDVVGMLFDDYDHMMHYVDRVINMLDLLVLDGLFKRNWIRFIVSNDLNVDEACRDLLTKHHSKNWITWNSYNFIRSPSGQEMLRDTDHLYIMLDCHANTDELFLYKDNKVFWLMLKE